MKKVFLFMLVLVSISFLFGKEMFVVNANSQTIGKVDLTSFTANNNFCQIGMYGNDIKIYDDKIYVVNSGDNEIQVINVNTGENIAIIELEDSANPWSIIFYEDFAYVTGMMTNKLYKIDLSNSQVSDSMEIGIGPEAMIIVNDKLYVTLTGVQYPNYSIGKVALIDLNNFTKITEIEVGTNPQGIIYINNQFLHIMCTGNYNDIKGSVFIVDVNTGQVIHTISFISSFLTTIQPGIDDLVYVGDAFGSGLLSYNIESYDIVNDASNPAFAGGSHLIYDESYYYVLNPGDWVGSSKFQIYDYSKQLVDEINLGIGASAMVMNQINTNLVDTVVPQLKEINAYPNPFNDQINFELTNNEKSLNEKRTIEIFNIRGQKINTLKGNKVQWDGKDYNSKTVPAGVYFARMLNEHNNYKTKKILKIK